MPWDLFGFGRQYIPHLDASLTHLLSDPKVSFQWDMEQRKTLQ